jgi:hypothetical protein
MSIGHGSKGVIMSVVDDLVDPDEDDIPQGCTGDPFTCPCEICTDFRFDIAKESDEGQEAA